MLGRRRRARGVWRPDVTSKTGKTRSGEPVTSVLRCSVDTSSFALSAGRIEHMFYFRMRVRSAAMTLATRMRFVRFLRDLPERRDLLVDEVAVPAEEPAPDPVLTHQPHRLRLFLTVRGAHP